MPRAALLVLPLLLLALGGCISQSTPTLPVQDAPKLPALPALNFSAPVRVDPDLVASEPSIKVAANGDIFIAAPTGVVKYATRPQDLLANAPGGPLQGQIWRSKDQGKTWQALDAFQSTPAPYHTLQPGGGDSDLAIDAKGTIYATDQFGLFTESVQVSTDGGDTWQGTTPDAGGQPTVDRQWLWPAPDKPGTIYLNFEHNGADGAGVVVSKSEDQGQTWTQTFASPVDTDPGPIVALPGGKVAFSLISGKDIHFVHSEDAAKTWKTDVILKDRNYTDSFPQTVADRAGNLYVAWTADHGNVTHVMYMVSKDGGATWSPPRLAVEHPGLGLFLWAAAGEEGRLGFSWYEAPDKAKEWFVHTAIVLGADTDHAQVTDTRLAGVVRTGEPCQNGVGCTSGRELGDFQQCAIAPDGRLVVSYVTVLDADQGGRITFARQEQGPRLLDKPLEPWVV